MAVRSRMGPSWWSTIEEVGVGPGRLGQQQCFVPGRAGQRWSRGPARPTTRGAPDAPAGRDAPWTFWPWSTTGVVGPMPTARSGLDRSASSQRPIHPLPVPAIGGAGSARCPWTRSGCSWDRRSPRPGRWPASWLPQLLESGQGRMEAEPLAEGKDLARLEGQGSPSRCVLRVLIGDHRVQPVVAAVQGDQHQRSTGGRPSEPPAVRRPAEHDVPRPGAESGTEHPGRPGTPGQGQERRADRGDGPCAGGLVRGPQVGPARAGSERRGVGSMAMANLSCHVLGGDQGQRGHQWRGRRPPA